MNNNTLLLLTNPHLETKPGVYYKKSTAHFKKVALLFLFSSFLLFFPRTLEPHANEKKSVSNTSQSFRVNNSGVRSLTCGLFRIR